MSIFNSVQTGIRQRIALIKSNRNVKYEKINTAYCLLLTAYCLLLTAYCLLNSNVANATTITAYGTPINSLSGSFNINSLLSQSLASSQISNAIVSFQFVGSDSTTLTGKTKNYTGSTGSYNSGYTDNYDVRNLYTDPLDSVTINFGTSTGTASDIGGAYSLTSNVEQLFSIGTHNVTYSYSCGGFFNSRTCYSSYYATDYEKDLITNTTEGYKGLFSFSSNLDPTDILSLSKNGILDYTININLGGVNLQSASLTLDATPIAPVPVPASAWLMGSAVLGLIGFKRRKC